MSSGKLMIQETVESFTSHFEQIFFAVLKEHDEKFHASIILKKLFPTSKVMIINEVTRGQAETIAKMIEFFNITDSFLVKDSDSNFKFSSAYESDKNYVSVCNAKKTPETLLYNKSFVEISNQEYILRTSLDIISNYFSCGGYFFSNASEFIENFYKYEEMQMEGEFFIANVIDVMIDDNHIFHPKECTELKDWGTFEDWINYKKSKSCYFFDIDGVIYENGSEFWEPRWGESKVMINAKNKVNDLFNSGNQIILTTSRSEEFREKTMNQLKNDGVSYHQLVMGIFHGTRYMINDYSNTNPYPVAKAINTKRNSCDFIEMID
ncbi:MAG: hypothetical protein CXT78_04650 [Thaumarchaeota archaeon]|jgi:hypothetical protein|nr:MAG: hypothetical protein CXT78_04650 [Nitrososphaerota archaeon]